MDNEMTVTEKIVLTVEKELNESYKDSNIRAQVIGMQRYKSLPITTSVVDNEVGLVLDDVILLTMLKTLKNGEKIPVYELFEKNGLKVLETQDDGMIRVEREIFEELIKDKIRAIEDAGYEVASLNTMDKNGKIESYFELINGKVTAINKTQKERLDRAEDRAVIMDDIDGETANAEPHKSVEDRQKQVNEQQKKQIEEDEQKRQQQISQDLGFSIFKMTKIDDPIFRMNNPQTRGKDIYAVFTHSGELKLVTKTDGHYENAEGFKDSGNATGRTTKIVNDEDSLDDNEINTYGEIYPTNRSDVRYTAEIAPDGKIKFVEQIRYDGSKMSKADEWISREVESSNTNYLDINREGAENSKNITARTFNRSSTNTDASKYGHSNGKGGVQEIGKALKDKKPTRTTMESMAADLNQRFDEAKRMVVEASKKTGASLDPDTEAAVDKRVQELVDNMNEPFTEETAEAVLVEVRMEIAKQKNEKSSKDIEKEETNKQEHDEEDKEEGRSRLEEEYRRKMGLY